MSATFMVRELDTNIAYCVYAVRAENSGVLDALTGVFTIRTYFLIYRETWIWEPAEHFRVDDDNESI